MKEIIFVGLFFCLVVFNSMSNKQVGEKEIIEYFYFSDTSSKGTYRTFVLFSYMTENKEETLEDLFCFETQDIEISRRYVEDLRRDGYISLPEHEARKKIRKEQAE